MTRNKICNLIISLYPISDLQRKEEIELCLKNNIQNTFITKILILNEGFESSILNHEKITNLEVDSRPKFKDFRLYLNENELNIIANNDIYFDNSIYKINRLRIKKGDFISLTRYESNKKIFREEFGDSQDVWLFIGSPEALKYCDFFMGIPGCDNRIAYILENEGHRVSNPCKVIKTWHVHKDNSRNYVEADRIYGKYLHIKPIGTFEFYWRRIIQYIYQKIRFSFNHFTR